MTSAAPEFHLYNTRPEHFGGIIALTREVYRAASPWTERQLASHLQVFPEGQLVVVQEATGRVVGMAASLIIFWDDYDMTANWRDFTDAGMFTNHDPKNGRTLYAAEVMTSPEFRRRGIARMMYDARFRLAKERRLLRIRAGARLAGYSQYADKLSPEEYVMQVIQEKLNDPTLSFQLSLGFHVLAVVQSYLSDDQPSRGFAAVIEWLNPQVATSADWAGIDPRFFRKESNTSSDA